MSTNAPRRHTGPPAPAGGEAKRSEAVKAVAMLEGVLTEPKASEAAVPLEIADEAGYESQLTQDFQQAEATVDHLRQKIEAHFLPKVKAVIAEGELDAAYRFALRIPDDAIRCFALDALREAGWTKPEPARGEVKEAALPQVGTTQKFFVLEADWKNPKPNRSRQHIDWTCLPSIKAGTDFVVETTVTRMEPADEARLKEMVGDKWEEKHAFRTDVTIRQFKNQTPKLPRMDAVKMGLSQLLKPVDVGDLPLASQVKTLDQGRQWHGVEYLKAMVDYFGHKEVKEALERYEELHPE